MCVVDGSRALDAMVNRRLLRRCRLVECRRMLCYKDEKEDGGRREWDGGE